jgi:SAM-dependent methyltransferase
MDSTSGTEATKATSERGDAYTALERPTGTISEQEHRRLEWQADLFASLAAWTLDALKLTPGDSLLEPGCGNGSLLAAAAERIGPPGRIVGVDRDPRLLVAARARTATYPWVEVVEADARAYDAGGAQFDAVHCRLVVMHQHDPDDFVEHMVGLTQPGGRLAAQEYDADDVPCFPRVPAWERMIQGGLAALRHVGADPQAGRKLVDRFRRAGLVEPQVEAYTPFVLFTDPRLLVMLDAFASIGAVCERVGIMPAAEYDGLVAIVGAAHADAAYAQHLVRLPTMVSVVGTKPALDKGVAKTKRA